MKKTKIFYWIVTGLMAAFMGLGAIYDASGAPEAVAYVTKLGYPAYIAQFLGVAKILGLIAILVPGFPRLKEWAYAGLIFDLIGAMYSHFMSGDPASTWGFIPLPMAFVFGSYFLYHKLRRQKLAQEGKTDIAFG
ncbi:DoxX family protein [Chitinophaga barathri]|uniref:DoxX family protein n=1 Tax=Chitinophaga barathri TaxID=1647451 RepID=A0A3N4MAB5_9BACT|nr:DoxX family protein [Chitinophaga barathri]RPD38636.1 DoxX family protein [Chitinophaga barathri]